MAALSEIVRRAYEELGQLDEISQLTRNQMNRGLERLRSLITTYYGYEAGETLVDWPLGNYGRESQSDETFDNTLLARPPVNSRLIHTAEEAKTIYFDPRPSDGARMAIKDPHGRLSTYNVTLDGNGRTIAGAATVALSTDNLDRTWFYRADLGDWVQISALAGTDDMPFPEEFDMLFIILLALRLAPSREDRIGDASMTMMGRLRNQFMARYVQSQDLNINPDLERQRMAGYDAGYSSRNYFNRGWAP